MISQGKPRSIVGTNKDTDVSLLEDDAGDSSKGAATPANTPWDQLLLPQNNIASPTTKYGTVRTPHWHPIRGRAAWFCDEKLLVEPFDVVKQQGVIVPNMCLLWSLEEASASGKTHCSIADEPVDGSDSRTNGRWQKNFGHEFTPLVETQVNDFRI
jgi:hypothetical protein